MRVALIVPVFPRLSESFLIAKALGLVARGTDIRVVCTDSDAHHWDAFPLDDPVHSLRRRVSTVPASRPRSAVAGSLVRTLKRAAEANPVGLRRTLRSGSPTAVARNLLLDGPLYDLRPDIVHFEFGALAVGREHVGRRLGASVCVSFRGSDANYIGLDTPGFYDELWGVADGIHVLGEAVWLRARERGAPADLPHTVINPAVDLEGIQVTERVPTTVGTERRPLRVLSVGRLHWTKGYDDALEAIARLRDQGIQVEHRIVGEGDLLPAVGFWRHQLGLDRCVELLGACPPSEVAAQFRWADVLLHAAVAEGFCNVALEAQAHGVPVVCTDAGGLRENVAHGVTGIVVSRRRPDEAAAALARLATDGRLRVDLGRAGRSRVERRFRFADHLTAWEHFYADVAERGRARR